MCDIQNIAVLGLARQRTHAHDTTITCIYHSIPYNIDIANVYAPRDQHRMLKPACFPISLASKYNYAYVICTLLPLPGRGDGSLLELLQYLYM